MRGFPLLNLLAVSAVLAFLLIPMLGINRPAATAPAEGMGEAQPAGAESRVPVMILLRFVAEPAEVRVSVEGEPLPLEGSGLQRQVLVPLELSNGGLELEIHARWPSASQSGMVEIRAAPDGQTELLQNVWSEGPVLEDWVRFQWKNPL